MILFDVKWQTHHSRAGGTGRLEADDIADAIQKTREIVATDMKLTKTEIKKLIIEVQEVA